MVTSHELLCVLLLPLVVSAAVAALGRWRVWPWGAPLAAGAGFLAGYGALGVPRLPPSDGIDWLFWLAVPLTVLGALIAKFGGRWGWLLGLAAGGLSYGIARPLVPGAVPVGTALGLAAGFAAAGVALSATTRLAAARLGAPAVGLAWSGLLVCTAIVVMSSNLRVLGVYGLAAGSALLPAGVLGAPRLRGYGPVAAGLLAGLLTGGRLYPEPGVSLTNLLVLTAAPLLLLPAGFLPVRRRWLRGLIGMTLVAIAALAVTIPTALAAKHAAEDDPYGAGG